MPLALRLSEGLGRTGEAPPYTLNFMALILVAPKRSGKSIRGSSRLGDKGSTARRLAPCFKPQPLWPERSGVPTALRRRHRASRAVVSAFGGFFPYLD